MVDVRFRGEQLVDLRFPLGFRIAGIVQERAGLVGRGRHAGQIERDPTQKLGISTEARRLNLQLPQLRVDVRIDEVELRAVFPGEARTVAQNGDRVDSVGAFVADEDRRFSAADRLDRSRQLARVLDRGDVEIAAAVDRFAGHIARRAIIEMSDHHLGQFAAFAVEHWIDGEHFDPGDAGHRIERRPFGDPLVQQLVVPRVFVEEEPAHVRHTLGRLQQHQRLAGVGPVEPPSGQLVDQRVVIEAGVVAAKRQLETGLAVLRAVTGPRVAARLAHDGRHFAGVTDRCWRHIGHYERHFDRPPRGGHGHLPIPHGHGGHIPIRVKRGDRVGRLDGRRGGQIDEVARSGFPQDEQATAIANALQFERGWQRDQFRHLRRFGGGCFSPSQWGQKRDETDRRDIVRQSHDEALSARFATVCGTFGRRLEFRGCVTSWPLPVKS